VTKTQKKLRSDPTLLVFSAEGHAFDDGFDLRSVERLLPEYRRLVDVALSQLLHVPVAKLPNSVSYKARFEPGSLDTVVNILSIATPIAATHLALDPGAVKTAQFVFGFLNKVIELRKKVKELLEKNTKLPEFRLNMSHANLSEAVQVPIIVNGDNNTITVSPQIYAGAIASHGPINRLARVVDGQQISSVGLTQGSSTGESLTAADRDLAKFTLVGDSLEVKVQGLLYEVNTKSRTGRLEIGDNRYPIEWSSGLTQKIRSLMDVPMAVFVVQPIADLTRLSESPVKFVVSDCYEGQLSL
jgi:hypothetical protein